MLLAGAFVFGFASCSNDSSDSSSSSATTAAAYKNSDGSKVWNFYSDGSWAAWYKDAVNAGVADGIIKKGTYTIYEGSFTADSGNVYHKRNESKTGLGRCYKLKLIDRYIWS